MLESLFGEDADGGWESTGGEQGLRAARAGLSRPSAPRNATQLSGLSNLGATCYLNSLLQTLHFTPEFRESLFRVGEEELGKYNEEEGADNSHVRIIPVQLQMLFARLLLLNQQSCRIDGLISSFGWTNNEEMQQHDVQELNRILFSAIESSLVGTSGERLIGRLYHGTSVQQIACQVCGHISEREEEFLDIPVALTGRSHLEQALKEMYLDTELLEGANQYHCSTCNRLVDAKRGCHLRKLPPVMTFALLRFLYDFKKGERYKDTSQFKFPLQLDMADYCRAAPREAERAASEREVYELYSVVIHSGSTHSGHYTAYIRDVDTLGHWSNPDDDVVQMPSDGSTGKVDFLEFDTPTELLQSLLHQLGGSAPINKLCKSMQDKTGVTWNKRFKKQFGSIHQFIKACPDFFLVNELNHVSLNTSPPGDTPAGPPGDTPASPMDTLPVPQFEPMDTQKTTDVVVEGEGGGEGGGEGEGGGRGEGGEGGNGERGGKDLTGSERDGERMEGSAEIEGMQVVPSDIVDEDLSALPTGLVEKEDTDSQKPSREQVQNSQNPSNGYSISSQGIDGSAAMETEEGSEGSKVKVGAKGEHNKSGGKGRGQKGGGAGKSKDPPLPPPPGQCWFQFNDTHVTPTLTKALDKMYQGKQSAYMLFYRKTSLQRTVESHTSFVDGIPVWLQCQVAMENARLEEERQQYEIAVNTIQLNIHQSTSYNFSNGALHLKKDAEVTVVSIDRRRTVRDLTATIMEALPELVGDCNAISVARKLPAGMHIYDTISGNESVVIQDLDILDNSNLFIWDGKQVDGETIQTGASCEPVLLKVTHPILEQEEEEEEEGEEGEGGSGEAGDAERVLEIARAKDSTLGELRAVLASLLSVKTQQLTLSQVKTAERGNKSSCVVVLHSSKDKNTLEQLKLIDGDQLAAETSIKKGMKTLAHAVADKQNNLLSVIVEDRCSSQSSENYSYPVVAMAVTKDTLLASFKAAILSKINLLSVEGGGRLRLDDDGVGPPLHEGQSLDQAGVVQGHRIILEPGLAPTSTQLALRCILASGSKEWEVIVDRSMTVAECCIVMTQTAALEGTQWHLRKTNWCGEAAEVLEDETAMLHREHIKSGDLLLIEDGKLPPKGFIRLSISLYTPPSPLHYPSYLTDPAHSAGLLSWIISTATVMGDDNEQGLTHETHSPEVDAKEVPLHLRSLAHHYPVLPGFLMELDNIEIHREATIEELKSQILTLPVLEDVSVPTLGFMRVREVIDGQLGKIFKQPQQTLRRQKLTTGSHICATILEYEETLPSTTVVFTVQARSLGRRTYGPPTEVVYDTSLSTKPSVMVKFLSRLLEIPEDRLAIAKHKLESFEWIRLQDNYNKEGTKKGRGRKAKGSGAVNIKNNPICLRDGDTLGVKDLQYDPEDSDDFSTVSDDRGKAILAALQEEKRRKRKLKSNDDIFTGGSHQRPRRTEVGITIHVPDYKRN